jgi:glycosyltransferase involved in cell wall biosynthesis
LLRFLAAPKGRRCHVPWSERKWTQVVKVVIQVPCLNEEATLPLVFEHMPHEIPGVDSIEFLVIDDGSTDRTAEVARQLGVRHFVHHTRNMGLGQSFHDGVLKALEMGADIVVNTDGDNQYPSDRIADLVQPIIRGEADIVIADRQTHTIPHFSPVKRRLQKVGSRVVNIAAGTDLPDAASGFRAYSREALLRINTVTRFSYCMETIIQAGNKRLAITSIPIETNEKTRESRLFKNVGEHVTRSAATILRAYIMYRPMVVFATTGLIFLAVSLLALVRILVLLIFSTAPFHHTESLVAGTALLISALLSFALGVLADLIRINRILLEDSLEQQKRHRYGVDLEFRQTTVEALTADSPGLANR